MMRSLLICYLAFGLGRFVNLLYPASAFFVVLILLEHSVLARMFRPSLLVTTNRLAIDSGDHRSF